MSAPLLLTRSLLGPAVSVPLLWALGHVTVGPVSDQALNGSGYLLTRQTPQ